LYKPPGVISTASDPQGRPTVTGLVPDDPRVFPVGRLDADSEGLLLLTNDGDLANYLTHPRFGVEKHYTVRVRGRPEKSALKRLEAGVDLDDGPARAVRARLVDDQGEQALIEVVMAEGRKREVRRLMDAIGHTVLDLVRTKIGALGDRRLRAGEWRDLTIDEIRTLYSSGSEPWDHAAAPPSEGN
jgi:pseudouridine synthase